MILKEFDPNPIALINPTDIIKEVPGMPRVAVSCFASDTFNRLVEELHGQQIAFSHCANTIFPVYKACYNGTDIALFMADVGAPACAALIEDIYTMGTETIVMFGTCGVLDKSIEDCSIIIPTSAVRDEGTSFHYAPPSDEIAVNPKYIDDFVNILDACKCSYTLGKTWTNDAIYRETREKVQRRKDQGCICVDMECSALAAVAQFRHKELFQFFYAADNLDAEDWDKRSLSNTTNLVLKDRIALLAMELAVRISQKEAD